MDFKQWFNQYLNTRLSNVKRRITERIKSIEENRSLLWAAQKELKSVLKDIRGKSTDGLVYRKTTLENTVAYRRRDLKTAITRLATDRKIIKAAKQKTAGDVYRRLMSHPKLSSVSVTDSSLHVCTKELMWPGERKDVGVFDIEIYSTTIGIFRIDNLKYDVDGEYQHPNIRTTEPCFGSWYEPIELYDKSAQLLHLVDAIVFYLENYTDDSPFINHERFLDERTVRDDWKPLVKSQT